MHDSRWLIIFIYVLMIAFTTHGDDGVTLVVSDVELTEGQAGEMRVYLSCPQANCAAIDISLRYDSSLLQVNSVGWGDYILSNSDIYPILSRHDDTTGEIQFTAVSLENISQPPEKIEILRLNVNLLRNSDTQISLEKTTIGDTDGLAIIPVNTRSGTVSHLEVQMPSVNCRLDIDANHIVDHNDLILTQQSYQNGQVYDSQFDVNQDGLVNILDVIAVSQNFGKVTEGCTS